MKQKSVVCYTTPPLAQGAHNSIMAHKHQHKQYVICCPPRVLGHPYPSSCCLTPRHQVQDCSHSRKRTAVTSDQQQQSLKERLSQGETRLLCQIIGGLLSFHTVCGIELWQKHVEARTRACTDLAKQDTNTKPLGVINQSSWPKLPATEPPFRGGQREVDCWAGERLG